MHIVCEAAEMTEHALEVVQVDCSQVFEPCFPLIFFFSLLEYVSIEHRITKWIRICSNDTNTQLLFHGPVSAAVLVCSSVLQQSPHVPGAVRTSSGTSAWAYSKRHHHMRNTNCRDKDNGIGLC